MRITFVLMILGILQANAVDVYSQNTRISVNFSDTRLISVLDRIESESEFHFMYNEKLMDTERKVSINAKDVLIPEVLDNLFEGTDVKYTIIDRKIILAPEDLNESRELSNDQQNRINGVVKDKSGLTLPGVNVVVTGTTQGAITDMDGKYIIDVPAGSRSLTFSFIGMEPQEVVIGTLSQINVTMVESATALEEVIVIGYGVQKKSLVTGAISSITSEQISSTSVSRAEQALQGKTAGVQVISTSGAPGADLKVRIRGYSSNGSADPLYIIDGVKSSNMSFLNPEDISNIEVLKDAASSAIYGAEGGNGVIIVTTKTGKLGTGEITYDYQNTVGKVGKVPQMLNSEEYANYNNEGGLVSIPASALTRSTNWMDEILEKSAASRHNLSFSSGNEKSNFLLSVSALTQDGIVVMDKDKFDRYTFRLNGDTKVKSWLKVGSSTSFAITKRNSIIEDNESAGIITAGLLMDPVTPARYDTGEPLPAHVQSLLNSGKALLKDENGNYYGISPYISKNPSNPFARLVTNHTGSKSYTLQGSLFAEIQPIDHFTFTTRVGYQVLNSVTSGWNPVYYYNNYQAFNEQSSVTAQESNTNYWQWENFGSYTNKFNLHNLNVLAGMSAESRTYEYIDAAGGPMLVENQDFARLSFITSQVGSSVGGNLFLDKKASYFGRVSYDYNNKYMLQGTIRRDGAGTSMLPPANRWGIFPSFSAGWVFTQESFMPASFLSYGKLRASWGQNGSLSNLSNYMYNSVITSQYLMYQLGDLSMTTAAVPNQLNNPDLTWETSVQTDIGLDLRMLKDKLTLTVDYFNKKTTDLITPNTPPLESGNNASAVNGGDITNTGFEFQTSFKNSIGDFNYNLSGNLSTLHNEVTFLNKTIQRILGGQSSGAATFFTAFEQGFPVWYFRGYKTDGINMTTGQANFIDQNGDGLINENDRVFIGSSIPKITYGAAVNLSYKGFELSANVQGQSGNHNMILWMRNDLPGSNTPKFLYEGRWTPGSTTATRPKAGFDPNTLLSDQMLFNGDYMRVKQIQIGYSLPKSVIQIIKLKSAKLYLSLEDYFTVTKYPGMDPEAGSTLNSNLGLDKGMYPVTKKTTFGISITL
jgi:TonB-linked SusC/RagA family outer membrane protein